MKKITTKIKYAFDLPLSKKIGYLLILPPLIFAILILVKITFRINLIDIVFEENWLGVSYWLNNNHQRGAYTASDVLKSGFDSGIIQYLGLSSIAGAYLIKENIK
jgi:hypothetical protein